VINFSLLKQNHKFIRQKFQKQKEKGDKKTKKKKKGAKLLTPFPKGGGVKRGFPCKEKEKK